MTSLEYYIEQIEQFISALTDDIGSGEGTVVTQTKLAVYREVLEHLEEIEQEPCEDAISREWLKIAIHNFYHGLKHTPTEEDIQAYIDAAPPVNPQNCDNCEVGNPCLYCRHEFEPQERNDKCKNCEYYRNPDYTRCHECEADKEQNDNGFFDEIMDDESDGEVYEKIKEIIEKVKEQEE